MRISIILLALFMIAYSACQQDPSLTENRDLLRIDGFIPDSGYVGDMVTIYGKGFAEVTSDNEIKIGFTNSSTVRSTDSTLTVKIMPNTITGKVSVIVGNTVAVSTKDFKILKDTVSAWQTIKLNIGVIRNIHFLNAAKGFCATDEGLFRSLDSGKTWSPIHLSKHPEFFFGFNFNNNQYGYCVGRKVYSYTTDGGNTWKFQKISFDGFATSFITPAIGYAAAHDGLYITNDTGLHWKKIYSTAAHGVYFKNEQNGWVVTEGEILKTIDGGTTMAQKFSWGTVLLADIKFSSEKIGWVHTLGMHLLKTTDGGDNWFKQEVPGVYTFSILNDNIIYIAGMGAIHQSRDGGKTWKKHHRISGHEFEEVFFLDEKTGWASDAGGNLYRFKVP